MAANQSKIDRARDVESLETLDEQLERLKERDRLARVELEKARAREEASHAKMLKWKRISENLDYANEKLGRVEKGVYVCCGLVLAVVWMKKMLR